MIKDTTFIFDEFDTKRAMYSRPAAKVYFADGGSHDWFWMSESDIDQNIEEFGQHPELLKAKEYYRTKEPTKGLAKETLKEIYNDGGGNDSNTAI